ncbi:hypothetical protein CDD80_1830 [Ophiocordyceps camponoti-rufipedis]|uniref:Enterotoxin n=1 Tax=Ophiocordyceps camponoti-rufipedis TaxID=2004952 RepID=A0A2C5Z8J6_9HYPO|nr:hypothetical protein CDD80_1830 [Ophiocordyceps camponoti-rufipedis]
MWAPSFKLATLAATLSLVGSGLGQAGNDQQARKETTVRPSLPRVTEVWLWHPGLRIDIRRAGGFLPARTDYVDASRAFDLGHHIGGPPGGNQQTAYVTTLVNRPMIPRNARGVLYHIHASRNMLMPLSADGTYTHAYALGAIHWNQVMSTIEYLAPGWRPEEDNIEYNSVYNGQSATPVDSTMMTLLDNPNLWDCEFQRSWAMLFARRTLPNINDGDGQQVLPVRLLPGPAQPQGSQGPVPPQEPQPGCSSWQPGTEGEMQCRAGTTARKPEEIPEEEEEPQSECSSLQPGTEAESQCRAKAKKRPSSAEEDAPDPANLPFKKRPVIIDINSDSKSSDEQGYMYCAAQQNCSPGSANCENLARLQQYSQEWVNTQLGSQGSSPEPAQVESPLIVVDSPASQESSPEPAQVEASPPVRPIPTMAVAPDAAGQQNPALVLSNPNPGPHSKRSARQDHPSPAQCDEARRDISKLDSCQHISNLEAYLKLSDDRWSGTDANINIKIAGPKHSFNFTIATEPSPGHRNGGSIDLFAGHHVGFDEITDITHVTLGSQRIDGRPAGNQWLFEGMSAVTTLDGVRD